MANIKSQKKRILTNEKARILNMSFKSKVRTQIKKVEKSVAANDKAAALEGLTLAVSLIDKSVVKHVQHAKTAARQKSYIQNLVNSLK